MTSTPSTGRPDLVSGALSTPTRPDDGTSPTGGGRWRSRRAIERSDTIRDPVPYLYRTAFRIAAAELRRAPEAPLDASVAAPEATGISPTSWQPSAASRRASALQSSCTTKPTSRCARWRG